MTEIEDKTTQLNVRVGQDKKRDLKAVASQTGVAMELYVEDGLRLLAGCADAETRLRVRLFREALRKVKEQGVG